MKTYVYKILFVGSMLAWVNLFCPARLIKPLQKGSFGIQMPPLGPQMPMFVQYSEKHVCGKRGGWIIDEISYYGAVFARVEEQRASLCRNGLGAHVERIEAVRDVFMKAIFTPQSLVNFQASQAQGESLACLNEVARNLRPDQIVLLMQYCSEIMLCDLIVFIGVLSAIANGTFQRFGLRTKRYENQFLFDYIEGMFFIHYLSCTCCTLTIERALAGFVKFVKRMGFWACATNYLLEKYKVKQSESCLDGGREIFWQD